MKYFFLLGILLFPVVSFSQDDNNDIAIGIGSYFFQYQEYHGGSVAIGPTAYFIDQDISLQVGLLFDLQEYVQYEGTHAGHTIRKFHQPLIPIFGHYRFYKKERINLFATFGIILGGNNYLDENGSTKSSSGFHLILGAGASYLAFNRCFFCLYPTLSYCSSEFNGGAMVEFVVYLGKEKELRTITGI